MEEKKQTNLHWEGEYLSVFLVPFLSSLWLVPLWTQTPPVSVVLSVAGKAVVPAMGIDVRIPVVGPPVGIIVGPILLVLVHTSYHRRRQSPRRQGWSCHLCSTPCRLRCNLPRQSASIYSLGYFRSRGVPLPLLSIHVSPSPPLPPPPTPPETRTRVDRGAPK